MRKIISVLSIFFIAASACSSPEPADEDSRFRHMQDFVKNISLYARSKKQGFIIIPQNGIELAFHNAEPDEGIMTSYIDAIDGAGIEELFYEGIPAGDNERLEMARILVDKITIMVSDFVLTETDMSSSVTKNENECFISFQRGSDNYDYRFIPETINFENGNDISKLRDAKNFLYLISSDNYSRKEEMIDAIAATNYDVILIDMFSFSYDDAFTEAEITRLKKKANGKNRLVISYMSIGSAENYRYYWKPDWKEGSPSWIGNNYEGYPNEFWVEFWNPEWQNIIYGNNDSYLKKIIDAGFDGVYLDNVEAYYFLN